MNWDEIRRKVDEEPSYDSYGWRQRVGREMVTACRNMDGPNKVRVAITSWHNIDNLAYQMVLDCIREGICPDFFVDGFGAIEPSMLNQRSALYAGEPEVTFAFPGARSDLKQLVEAFVAYGTGLLVMATPMGLPFGVQTGVDHLLSTDSFADSFDDHVAPLALDHLCAYYGRQRVTNWKLFYSGGMAFGKGFVDLLGKKCVAYLRSWCGLNKKCLVLDLDGTLWGGIVGEDGLGRINMGGPFVDFQREILELHRRGVILTVNSRNNVEDAMAALEHAEMVLHPKHFACIKANWQDKSVNMREIAEEINIGLDSMVFLDDDPVQRELVRQVLPEVLVPDLPTDSVHYPGFVRRHLNMLTGLFITDTDRKRGEMYAQERERRGVKKAAATFGEYLASLEMELTVGVMLESEIPRVSQLTKRTNQFNMTTVRMSEEDVGRAHEVHVLYVEDRFGGSGLVGVIMIKYMTGLDTAIISNFMMSCRVLGRGIERAFLTEVLNDLSLRRTRVVAEFVATKKNRSAEGFYEAFGFSHTSVDGNVWLGLDLRKWKPEEAPWFKVTRR